MALLALAIGQPADGEQIRRLEQADAVVERQPLAGVELVGDVGEAGAPQTRGGKGHRRSDGRRAEARAYVPVTDADVPTA